MAADPWLPPVTKTTGTSGGMPSSARPVSLVHVSSDRRMGLPSTKVRPRGSTRSDPSNVAPIRCDHPASIRLTRPGIAFPSQMYTGTRAMRAARTAGSDARPPVVQQTFGLNRRISANASAVASGITAARETSEKRESGSRRDGIAVAWNGIPEPATSSASRPRRPPMNRKRVSGSLALRASATARSGLTCPPVPPPTRSTRHARPLCGSGSTNVQEDTHGDEPDTERAAAVRDKRERDAGHRHEARDDGHVHPRLEAEPHRDADGEQGTGRILRPEGDANPPEREREEEQDDHERTRQTELVAEHREDRVGVWVRQIAELFLPRPEPLAERAAEAERVEHLDRLETEFLWIGPRIEERHEPLKAVRLGDGEREDDHSGQTAQRRELAQPRARGEVHGERDDHDDDRGAQIGLGHDQADDERRHEDEGQGDAPRADLLALPAEPGREVHDERELRELGRLQPEAATKTQPARRAAGGDAHARYENGTEQSHGDEEQRHRDEAEHAVVDT